jgi:hypothetical protein
MRIGKMAVNCLDCSIQENCIGPACCVVRRSCCGKSMLVGYDAGTKSNYTAVKQAYNSGSQAPVRIATFT